jgi:hypothetical protein
MIKKHQQNVMGFNRKVYYAYIVVKLGDQNKSRALHKVCYVAMLIVTSLKIRKLSCYTKYPCFMCEWGNRARSQHWGQKHWAPRTSLEPGSKDILCKSLVNLNKTLLPPLYIKLGIKKQFVNALPRIGNFFKYFCKTFPHLLEAKLKEGIFVAADIRKLMFNEDFLLMMTVVERES